MVTGVNLVPGGSWRPLPNPPQSLLPKASGRMEQCPGGPRWPEAEAGEEKEGGNGHEQEGREKKTEEKSYDFFFKVTPEQPLWLRMALASSRRDG